MSCYYPMEAVKYYDGSVKVTGALENGMHSQRFKDDPNVKEFLTVPCGKCIGCRLEYSRQWAIRCMKELETTKGPAYFLTLTYDNDHLPYHSYLEEGSGIKVSMPELRPKDLQDFIKRLRERLRAKGVENFRFFACGEYGDELKRPHYHMIAYNLPLDDLEYYKSIRGHEYYNSKFLDECWHNQGFVVASDVNFECCAYVARYVMKKAQGPNGFSYASDNGLVDEFVRMSRRPGIGREYYELHKDEIYKKDNIGYLPTQNGPILLKPAKYYDKLYDVEYDLEAIREKRVAKAQQVEALKMSQTSVSSIEYRGILERDKAQKISLLKRNLDI